MSADKFTDSVVGEVIVKRHQWSSGISLKYSVSGDLVATAPKHIPLIFIKQVVRSKRSEILAIKNRQNLPVYQDGQEIGKSHRLKLVPTIVDNPSVKVSQRTVILSLESVDDINRPEVQRLIQKEVIKIHRCEAKAYLPRRLSLLAERHGYSYSRLRFTHAGTRWGSCSSSGTISLNIALMKLPLELIDYVLIHELCHTVQMNHSTAFWDLVKTAHQDYRISRKSLKSYSPSL